VCRIRDVILKLPTPYALSGYWINIEFTGTTNCSKIFHVQVFKKSINFKGENDA
jgi:hypothetical protein